MHSGESRAWPSRSTRQGDGRITHCWFAVTLRWKCCEDVSDEYAASARRYFGDEQGKAWVERLSGQPMARITVTPSWVGVLDFETRFPSALSM